MGYILPIQQYQYNDYQKRIIEEKQNPYFIGKSFKVVLETQYEEIKEKTNLNNGIFPDAHLQESPNKLKSEKLFSNLTGKGMLFSESI